MYHALETGITVSIFYLISFFFYRAGLYSQTFHRKLWNVVLAATFLFTALAGILMALQINYKWNIPSIKAILKWHVEVGVCLGITGIFHFLWHLQYFSKLFKAGINSIADPGFKTIDKSSIRYNLFALGFTGTSVQFLLMREIMIISGGYELITGIYLGSWLIASASGAAIAGRSALNDIRKINLIFTISPFISLFLLLLLSRIFSNTGETPSLLASILFTFLMLAPFCLVSGFAFVKLLSAAREANNTDPGKSFSIETIGGIAAGLIMSLLTAGIFNTYKILLVIIILYAAYCILTFYINGRTIKILIKLFFTVLLSVVIIADPDIFFRQLLFPGIRVIETKDTPYGNITKGEYSGDISSYYNHRLLAYNDDAIEREEDIHYALLQRPDPEKVILISGLPESHLKEIAKYHVNKIIFIERDPALVKSAASLKEKGFPQLETESRDAYKYIRSNEESVNAVILLLPPPSTLSLNRFYTLEFFSAVKKRLVNDGVFMCSPGQGENYLNRESVNLYSSIYNSLSGVFRYVVPVAGSKLYFIASDEELSVDFCKLAVARGIKNIYVSQDYLSDDLTERKSAEVIATIDKGTRQNRAFFPIACFHFQSYSLSRDLNEKVPAIIILICAFAVPVLAVRRRNLIMYFSASALAGFEIIIMLAVQLTAGNMYQFTGAILASVMAGLATGAGTNDKYLKAVPLKIEALFLVFYYTCIALFFNFFTEIGSISLVVILILFLAFIPSYVTGNIFRNLTLKNDANSTPAAVYSADLAGSALGFILITGVAIPAFGIKVSVFFLTILLITGILFGSNRNK